MLLGIECAACAATHDATRLLNVCERCGRSLSARYDLGPLADALRGRRMSDRPRSMWRYAEVLPDPPRDAPVSLGEGFTPLVELPRTAARFRCARVWVKDESTNPTGSFKARGLSAAVTAAAARGARALALPSAGNAASALAAYARRAGLAARVYLPEDAPETNRLEVRLLGAEVLEVKGTIADAAARMRADRALGPPHDEFFDLSTLKEPFRLDGKKTLGYELFEALGGELPDVIVYPTGGGTGLLGMAKAFDELEAASLIGKTRPAMVSVQSVVAGGVAAAFASGATETRPADAGGKTIAAGLNVPKAFADWWILKEIRRTNGAAYAVDDAAILAQMRATAETEGFLACPEGAATLAALPRLADAGKLAGARVVVFNTASAFKYPEALALLRSP